MYCIKFNSIVEKNIYIHILFNIHIFCFRMFKAFSEGLEGPDGSPLVFTKFEKHFAQLSLLI